MGVHMKTFRIKNLSYLEIREKDMKTSEIGQALFPR